MIIAQYRDWERGIPPSREWSGRGGQNRWLLAAFDRLRSVDMDLREAAEKRREQEADRARRRNG